MLECFDEKADKLLAKIVNQMRLRQAYEDALGIPIEIKHGKIPLIITASYAAQASDDCMACLLLVRCPELQKSSERVVDRVRRILSGTIRRFELIIAYRKFLKLEDDGNRTFGTNNKISPFLRLLFLKRVSPDCWNCRKIMR